MLRIRKLSILINSTLGRNINFRLGFQLCVQLYKDLEGRVLFEGMILNTKFVIAELQSLGELLLINFDLP